jgi:hypothetical protein
MGKNAAAHRDLICLKAGNNFSCGGILPPQMRWSLFAAATGNKKKHCHHTQQTTTITAHLIHLYLIFLLLFLLVRCILIQPL